MTRVYLEPAAAEIENGGGGAVDPDAVRSLRYLVEAGHELVLVSSSGREPSEELRALATSTVPSPPTRPDRQSWLLTTDVASCQGSSARIRTVLIGAAPPPGSVRRCDATARDVQAAIMEILASEAMPPAS